MVNYRHGYKMKNITNKTCFHMYGLLIVIMSVCFLMSACSTDATKQRLEEGILYPMYEKGSIEDKWGYIDSSGEYVIEPQFLYAGPFSDEGLAAVQDAESELWGYIDNFGDWVIYPQFVCAFEFKDGMAKVGERIESEYFDNGATVYGYIDTYGEIIIPLEFYDIIKKEGTGQFVGQVTESHFSEDEDWIEGLWAYFDEDTYNEIFDEDLFVFTDDIRLEYSDYSEGPVAKINQKNKVGFVNEEGEYVIKPQKIYGFWSYPLIFYDGMCPVFHDPNEDESFEMDDRYNLNYIYGFMDETGKMCTKMIYYAEGLPAFHDGYALVRTLPNKGGMVDYGYIDKKGNWVIKKQYNKKLDKD